MDGGSKLDNSISRVLIETMVKKMLREMKEEPRRSTRNLVDLAVQFAKGRFQSYFLELIQNMLTNDKSAYFELVQDTVEHVGQERLLNFGMNVGYNSCTLGAKRIREWESSHGYNVPWAIALEVDKCGFQQSPKRYMSLVAEGEELGIFTWMLFVKEVTTEILTLIESYPDHAFFVFIDSINLTESLIEEILTLDNVMILVEYKDDVTECCKKLRKHRILYGIYYQYDWEGLDEIKSGNLFYDSQAMHAMATVLIPKRECSEELKDDVYQIAKDVRNSQRFSTIAWDLRGDNCFVDKVISDDDCFVYFNKDGDLCGWNQVVVENKKVLFQKRLQQILMENFPKNYD